MVAANDRIAVAFKLSEGQWHDAPQGRRLLETAGFSSLMTDGYKIKLLADRAYEDNKTRNLIAEKEFMPVIPPKVNRKEPWEYDRGIYKRRNEVERLFRRIKRFRRVFTRYDKTDIMYIAFVMYALIIDYLISVRFRIY
jgi:transposase